MGVAPRRLWGWEPSEFHETVRENGRIVGTRITREPEFDREQLILLLAASRLDADIGPHGHPMSEATSSEADPAVAGGWRYSAGPYPDIDFAQQALDRAQATYDAANKNSDRAGHVWRVRRIDS